MKSNGHAHPSHTQPPPGPPTPDPLVLVPLPSRSRPEAELVELGRKHAVRFVERRTPAILDRAADHDLEAFGIDQAWHAGMRAALREIDRLTKAQSADADEAHTRPALRRAVEAAVAWSRRAAAILVGATQVEIEPRVGKESAIPLTQDRVRALVGQVRVSGQPGAHREADRGEALLATLDDAVDARRDARAQQAKRARAIRLEVGVIARELKRLASVARRAMPDRASELTLGYRRTRGRKVTVGQATSAASPFAVASGPAPTAIVPAGTACGDVGEAGQ